VGWRVQDPDVGQMGLEEKSCRDCQAYGLYRENAVGHGGWRKLMGDGWWSRWLWVDVSAGTGSPG